MAGINKVILIGNLGSDPEVRHLEGGSVVARFNIATSEPYTNRNGERVEHTEWHRIELWDRLAKLAEQYLKKGNPVYIEGKLRSESWKDKEGVERTGVTIRATNMSFLGGRPDNAGTNGYTPEPQANAATVQEPAAPAVPSTPKPQPQPAAQTPKAKPAQRPAEPAQNDFDDDLPF